MKRIATLAVSAAVVLVALAGCSSPPPFVEPNIVWEQRSTSPLENDPWYKAAFASELGTVFAYNSHDFTIPQFIDTHSDISAFQISGSFELRYIDDKVAPIAYPGPPIWLPLSVNVAPDGRSAEVEFCDASAGWELTTKGENSYDLNNGRPRVYTMRKDDATGRVRYTALSGSDKPCDATGASIGRFEPVPLVPEKTLTPGDVRLAPEPDNSKP